jgi:hypothetical protein
MTEGNTYCHGCQLITDYETWSVDAMLGRYEVLTIS